MPFVEVDPLRDVCYLHGFVERCQGNDATERFVAFFAEEPTLAAERDAFAAALDYLAAHDQAVIYYYSKYERTTCIVSFNIDTRMFARRRMSNDCLKRRARSIFTRMWSCKRRNGRHVTTRSRRLPTILALLGVTPILRAQHPLSGLTGGAVGAPPNSASVFSTITRTIVVRRASCLTAFVALRLRTLPVSPNPSLRGSLAQGDAAHDRAIFDRIQ